MRTPGSHWGWTVLIILFMSVVVGGGVLCHHHANVPTRALSALGGQHHSAGTHLSSAAGCLLAVLPMTTPLVMLAPGWSTVLMVWLPTMLWVLHVYIPPRPAL